MGFLGAALPARESGERCKLLQRVRGGAPESLYFGVGLYWVLGNHVRTLIAGGLTTPVTVAIVALTAVIMVQIVGPPRDWYHKSVGNHPVRFCIT